MSAGGELCVKIHLHSGATYLLARIVDIASGWAIFDTYPKKDGTSETLNRVTIAYDAISHVTISIKAVRGLGFHIEAADTPTVN